MTRDPWTTPDPEPGDFDADLATLDAMDIEQHPGNPNAKLHLILALDAEAADRLTRLAAAEGKPPAELIANLLRDADQAVG